jgi:hypothetical protein
MITLSGTALTPLDDETFAAIVRIGDESGAPVARLFVSSAGEERDVAAGVGATFDTAGARWRVVDIDANGRRVIVTPA